MYRRIISIVLVIVVIMCCCASCTQTEDEMPENALSVSQRSEAFDEALQALVMLGFTKAASEKVLQKIFKADSSLGVEDAIRSALKQL